MLVEIVDVTITVGLFGRVEVTMVLVVIAVVEVVRGD